MDHVFPKSYVVLEQMAEMTAKLHCMLLMYSLYGLW